MAGLCLSHLRRYMLVMLYTNTQASVVLFVVDLLQICLKTCRNKSNQWSLSLTVHVLAKSRQLSVFVAISAVNIDRCCHVVNTLDVQLCRCMQRHMIDWA